MRLRALTATGVQQFRAFLARADAEALDAPRGLLTDQVASVEVNPAVELDDGSVFASRFEMAEYLTDRLQVFDRTALISNVELWSWLGLFYFDQLAPRDQQGIRRIFEEARYVLTTARRTHRHLIAGAFKIFDLAGDRARTILHVPPSTHGDFAEQLSSRMEFITNRNLIALVDWLYYDQEKAQPKRGATNRKKPGTLRRLIDVLQQLDLTYDIYGMEVEEFLDLLPPEFDRFRPDACSSTT